MHIYICNSSHFRPTPNVTWTKTQGSEHIVLEHFKDYDAASTQIGDQEKSKTVNHTHHMHLTNVKPDDTGYYECIGQNIAGKSLATRIRLDVEGKCLNSVFM